MLTYHSSLELSRGCNVTWPRPGRGKINMFGHAVKRTPSPQPPQLLLVERVATQPREIPKMRLHDPDNVLDDPTFPRAGVKPLTAAEALALADSYKDLEPGFMGPEGSFSADETDGSGSRHDTDDTEDARACSDPILLFSFAPAASSEATAVPSRAQPNASSSDELVASMYQDLRIKYRRALRQYQNEWRACQEKSRQWWRYGQAYPQRRSVAVPVWERTISDRLSAVTTASAATMETFPHPETYDAPSRNASTTGTDKPQIAHILHTSQGTMCGSRPKRLPTPQERAHLEQLKRFWNWRHQQRMLAGMNVGNRLLYLGSNYWLRSSYGLR